jgi:hypothetical protein
MKIKGGLIAVCHSQWAERDTSKPTGRAAALALPQVAEAPFSAWLLAVAVGRPLALWLAVAEWPWVWSRAVPAV